MEHSFFQMESYVLVTYEECYWSSKNLENIESSAIQKLRAKNEVEYGLASFHFFYFRKIV